MTAPVESPDLIGPPSDSVGAGSGVGRTGSTTLAAIALAGCGLAAACVLRVWILARVTVPAIVPDEIGTWSIARFLAGVRPGLPMRDSPVYPMGTGLLLAPVVRLFAGPVAQYRASLVVLGLLMIVAAVFVTMFVRGLGFGQPGEAAMCFILVLLFPATTLTSAYTWSETLALVALAGILVLTHRAFVRMTTIAWIAAACVAGALPFAHARFILVPIVWLACALSYISCTTAWHRARRWRTAAASIFCVATVYVAGTAVYRRVVGELWTHATPASPGLMHTVLTPRRWPQLLSQLGGEMWYAIAASFGLAAIGGVWITRSLSRWRDLPRAKRGTLVTTSFVFASVVAASVAIVANGIIQRGGRPVGRLDYYVQGRYVDGVVLILAAVGLAHLVSEGDRHRSTRVGALIVAAFVVLTLIVVWQLPDGIHGFFGPSIAGVYFLPFVHGFDIVVWGVVAIAGFVAIMTITRVRTALSMVVITVLLIGASSGASANAARDHRYWARRPLYAAVPPPSVGWDRAVVAADVAGKRSYRLYSFTQAYVLTGQGWTVEFSNLDSASLAAAPGPRTGVIVVLRSQPVRAPNWGVAGELAEAAVWFRAR